MTDDTRALSELTLERFRLGELPGPELADISARIAADPALRDRLAALAASDEQLRTSGMTEALARSVGALPEPRGLRWQWAGLASAVVLVVCAVVWNPGMTGDEADRVKGEAASLMLYRKTDSGSELLDDGASVRRGDLIRVAYRSGAPCFGVIISIDGAGVVTRHLPVDASAAAPMEPGDATALGTAYELDDAPKWERFFLITGDRPFDVQVVLEAARRTVRTAGGEPPDALTVPEGLRQSSFLLRKVS
jgi:hypothetical protein